MSHSSSRLTSELQRNIVSFVRAGGYPHVAAEAAGVSRRTFQNWMQRGGRRQAKQPYRGFAEEVRQAAAQAQLRAEIAIFDKRPLDWLKCGPGKENSRRPGWSAAPKAHAVRSSRNANVLADLAFQRLCGQLLDVLTPFPEARAALADQFPKWARSQRERVQTDDL
jgi:hypothetical protein